jgi:hypothetical protein
MRGRRGSVPPVPFRLTRPTRPTIRRDSALCGPPRQLARPDSGLPRRSGLPIRGRSRIRGRPTRRPGSGQVLQHARHRILNQQPQRLACRFESSLGVGDPCVVRWQLPGDNGFRRSLRRSPGAKPSPGGASRIPNLRGICGVSRGLRGGRPGSGPGGGACSGSGNTRQAGGEPDDEAHSGQFHDDAAKPFQGVENVHAGLSVTGKTWPTSGVFRTCELP